MRPILILDDDTDLLGLLVRALRSEGHRVISATNAADALALSAEEEPALIIADLMLPHVDGEAFLEEYRRQWPESRCPVMLLTASATREKVAERMGVSATLPKPFALEDLRALVRELT